MTRLSNKTTQKTKTPEKSLTCEFIQLLSKICNIPEMSKSFRWPIFDMNRGDPMYIF